MKLEERRPQKTEGDFDDKEKIEKSGKLFHMQSFFLKFFFEKSSKQYVFVVFRKGVAIFFAVLLG